MNNISIVGIDLAKHVFHLHAVDHQGREVFSKKVSRAALRKTLAQVPCCTVAMEACGSAHYWAREITALGHEVQLIPPQYVKPFVLGHKNDAKDARAITEAAARAATPRVAPKTLEQQALQAMHRVRSRAITTRTALGNELHGLLAEMGISVAKGHTVFRQGEVRRLLDEHRATLGDDLFVVLDDVLDQWLALDARIRAYDQRLARLAKTTPVCQRLMSVPGIGPVNATLLACHIGDPGRFANGRCFSASIGLVPKQHSSGGKERLLSISRRGNGEVRRQLVHGARAALRAFQRQQQPGRLARWACALAARRGAAKATVALANKLGRICWAVMARDTVYTATP
ncbi:IS110 family transposase [Franzmannia qiaohouensis]|uniref:IS110 family transposase n=1 Tax=Franzmannia qiaohouensis TaxID=1329370 RepID=A0ABU1HLF7_9GAMM|nr:IS110 family transposase [Halomonas qiaohouensis]MDR5907883.1 IS110 family transposase [Halomonas qiaohouensis]